MTKLNGAKFYIEWKRINDLYDLWYDEYDGSVQEWVNHKKFIAGEMKKAFKFTNKEINKIFTAFEGFFPNSSLDPEWSGVMTNWREFQLPVLMTISAKVYRSKVKP
jgi:hypothetical protein